MQDKALVQSVRLILERTSDKVWQEEIRRRLDVHKHALAAYDDLPTNANEKMLANAARRLREIVERDEHYENIVQRSR